MTINSWGSDDPAEVPKGGTGVSSLTDHGILLGNTTSDILVTAAPSNGQILIGTATPTSPNIAAPTGATNEFDVATGASSLTIGLADNAQMSITGALSVPDGTTGQEPGATDGLIRYDTTTNKLMGVENGVWVPLVGSAVANDAWVYLTTTTASSAASVIFNNSFINTFDSFIVLYQSVTLEDTGSETASRQLVMEFSSDNGSSWVSSGYLLRAYNQATTVTSSANVLLAVRAAGAWGGGIPVGDLPMQGLAFIYRLRLAAVTGFSIYSTTLWNTGGATNIEENGLVGHGQILTADVYDAIRIRPADAINMSGTVHLFAYRTS